MILANILDTDLLINNDHVTIFNLVSRARLLPILRSSQKGRSLARETIFN